MVSEQDLEKMATELGIEKAALKAVVEVECSNKGGFLRDGRARILFEGHIFWKRLAVRGLNPEEFAATHPDIVYPRWVRCHYKGGSGEWERFARAEKIHPAAAIESASWGMFQIMGFHWATCGCRSAEEFRGLMERSEADQMRLSLRFMQKTGVAKWLKTKDWANFALRYNGRGYRANRYDTRLAQAYERFRIEN